MNIIKSRKKKTVLIVIKKMLVTLFMHKISTLQVSNKQMYAL